MKQSPVILIAILAIAGAAFYLWTAVAAKKESDTILKKFKEVENRLASIKDTAAIKQRMENAQRIFPAAILKSQIILLIDSLKDDYALLPEHANAIDISKKKYAVIKRLLHMMQQLNHLKWDAKDSSMPDTISYWPETGKFNEQRWIKVYFDDVQKSEVITFLNYLRLQTLSSG